MKKMIVLVLAIVSIGCIISISGAYAATSYAISAAKIGYSDNSNLGVTDVQAAIDGTCSKANEVLKSKQDKKLQEIKSSTSNCRYN